MWQVLRNSSHEYDDLADLASFDPYLHETIDR